MNKILTTVVEEEGGKLQINIDVNDETVRSRGWAKCYFFTDTQEVYLGAEASTNLFPHLIDQLQSDAEGTFGREIFGQNARLVRTLSEAWCGIYVAPRDSARVLYFLNALDEPVYCIGKLKLSQPQWAQWCQQLDKLFNQDLALAG